MKIRVQILMAILPVFLALAVVTSVLNYTIRRQEIASALEEQTFSLATAISEFLDPEECRRLIENAEEPGSAQSSLEKVMAAGLVERLAVFSADGSALVFQLPAAETQSRSEWDLEAPSAQNGVLVSRIFQKANGRSVIRAFSPVLDASGAAALLAIEIDAGSLMAATSSILTQSIATLLSVLLLGTLISWLIARIVTQSIGHLNSAAEGVAAGRYDWRVQSGKLREVNDLGNTFNTMSSVLEEVLSRARRSLIEGEQFRTREDLARTFSAQLWRAEDRDFGNVLLSVNKFGNRPTGDFFCVWEEAGRALAVLGRVRADGDLDPVMMASAALRIVRGELATGSTPHGFALASQLFDLETWESVSWAPSGQQIEWWNGKEGEAAAKSLISLRKGRPIAIHNLQKEAADRVDLYLKLFASLGPGELMQELKFVLDEATQGGLMIVTAA